MDGVLYGADELVAGFVAERIERARGRGFGPCVALGHMRQNALVGGVVFHNFQPLDGDIEMSLAFDQPPRPSRATLRRLFAFPFAQLGLARITIRISAGHEPVRKLALGYGFEPEGVRKAAYLGTHDELILGMMRERCRWLQET